MARLFTDELFQDLIRSTAGQQTPATYAARNQAYPNSPMAVSRPLTELAKRNLLGSTDSYGERLASAQRELEAGEINRGTYAGRRLGVLGSVVGDVASALTPQFIEDALASGVQTVAETDLGQEAIRKYQDLQFQYPYAMATTGDLASGAELFAAGKALTGLKKGVHLLAANAPNALRFGDDDFYLGENAARQQILEGNSLFSLGSKATRPGEIEDWRVSGRQLGSRLTAMGKGFTEAFTNTVQQLSTPTLLAEWERGVSKKMKEVAQEGTQQQQWGQASYTNFLGKQYGSESEIFKALDNEYFTHKGVFNQKELQDALGLAEDEFGPIFRTIKANQPVDERTIMAVRQPTGRESSGDLINEVMNMSVVGKNLPNVFPMQKPFTDKEFLDLFEQGKRGTEMSRDERLATRFAFIENPNLGKITDPEEFRVEFKKAFEKAKKSEALNVDGNKAITFANAALKNKTRAPVKGNKELADLLNERVVKPTADGDSKVKMLRNEDQTNLKPEDRDIYLMDTYDSSAYELGGINIIYRVKPDGTVSAIVNDVNDIGIIPKIPSFTVGGKDVGKKAQKMFDKVLNLQAPLGEKLVVVTPPIKANLLKGTPEVSTSRGEASGGLKSVLEDVRQDVTPEGRHYRQAATNLGVAGSLALEPDFMTEDDPLAPSIR